MVESGEAPLVGVKVTGGVGADWPYSRVTCCQFHFPGESGGGIVNSGALRLERGLVSGNHAGRGGGYQTWDPDHGTDKRGPRGGGGRGAPPGLPRGSPDPTS